MKQSDKEAIYEEIAVGFVALAEVLTAITWLVAMSFFEPPFLTFIVKQGGAGANIIGLWTVLFSIIIFFEIFQLSIWSRAKRTIFAGLLTLGRLGERLSADEAVSHVVHSEAAA